MRKYPAVGRREYRPQGLTPGYLETMEEEAGNSDDEDLTATERARAALQRTAHTAEEDEVSLSHLRKMGSGFGVQPSLVT